MTKIYIQDVNINYPDDDDDDDNFMSCHLELYV